MHVQVCTLHRWFLISVLHIYKHTFRRVFTCARVCAVCSLVLDDECRGLQLVDAGHLLLVWDIIIYIRKDRGVVCMLSVFLRGWECMRVYCVYAHTHTGGILGCEPRGRDEKPGKPEESRWTKSCYTYIRICVQSTLVYICAERRDETLD